MKDEKASARAIAALLRPLAILGLVAAIGGCMPADISGEQRDVVLTGPELVSSGFASPAGAFDETWNGRLWFDGSRELEYTYETSSESEQIPLYLSVNVSWEVTRPDAIGVYGATLLGFKVGTASESIDSRELTDSCKYADRCTLLLLTRDQHPVGNQFVLQVGRTVYIMQLFGIYFDEPEAWHEMIAPKVSALKKPA